MTAWWRGAVMYQIYPRSFADSNGDGVGDLPGITERLPYVAELGVDGIWISPFFRSPMADYGYDVSDYQDVDPVFGTLADFDRLLERAHQLGLKVIIDQVYSHTSDQHPWFAQSRASRDNPKADWYVWADAKPDGSPPNNWQAVFGGPAWTWSLERRQYYLHNFLVEQPDLNFHNPAAQDALLDVARFWLDRDADGFRLDVANFYAHDPELRDNPPRDWKRPPLRPYMFQRHVYDRSRPETLDFMRRLRAVTDAYPDRMLLGEIECEEPLVRQLEYVRGQDRLHTAYSFYLLRAARADPATFKAALDGWTAEEGWPSWSLGNHDVPRFPTRLGGNDPQRTRLLLAVLVLLRGTAFLYQGEELGLPQAEIPRDRLRDPDAIRNHLAGAGRDGARTPMPWSAQAPNAGFSEAEDAWLPVDPRHAELAVDRQAADPFSTLAFTRRLLAFRKAHPAFRTGDLAFVDAPDDVLAFTREGEGERLLCLFNLGAETRRVSARGHALDSGLGGGSANGEVVLPPWAGAVLDQARP
jgi:alpha-glucosidase